MTRFVTWQSSNFSPIKSIWYCMSTASEECLFYTILWVGTKTGQLADNTSQACFPIKKPKY